ncbi:elongation factor Ts [Lachnospiraceae bacterium]|nr:elongation factor Ts [Lachnospiraceae bacterium]
MICSSRQMNDYLEDKKMAITASMVKELREQTGAGMMDCKKALTETDGDFDKAIEFLREKGLATAQKKAGRIAAEGIVSTTIKDGDKVAAIVEVNAETDFVAKNEVFRTYVKEVVEQAADTESADIEAFKAEPWALDTSVTVDEKLAAMIAKIGENMNIRRFEKIVSEDGIVVSYIHAGGKIGVLVEAKTDNASDTVKEALKNIAMQIAALNPKYVSTDEVPEDYKEHEKEILMAQAKNDPKNANKPENIIEKMIAGRLSKELKEVCLLEQEYVKAENKETVAKYLEAVSKEVGSEVTLKRFIRFETGEGLEKKNEDFAAEVAAQMNQ